MLLKTFTIKQLVCTLHHVYRISVCVRDNTEFIREEHVAEHHKMLNREAKDTVKRN